MNKPSHITLLALLSLTLLALPCFGQFGTVSFVPLSGPCSTNTLGFDTTNNVVYSCGTPPNNYWKVVTFETVNAGPLLGTCNPNSLGFDTTNNVVYSCGSPPNNSWQRLGGSGPGGGITGVLGQPAYGTSATTVQSVATELAADTFAGADICAKVMAAEAALPTTGGVIVLSAQNYPVCASSITINVKNVTLRGTGMGNWGLGTAATVLNFPAGVSGIVSTSEITVIKDMMVKSASTAAGSDNGVSFAGGSPRMERVIVQGFGGRGVVLNNQTDFWRLDSVYADHNKGDGFYWAPSCTDQNVGFAVGTSATSNGGIGYNIQCGATNYFQTTHAAANTGGAWLVNSTYNYITNAYVESGTGSSFTFASGASHNRATFNAFGQPSPITDLGTAGTNVIEYDGSGGTDGVYPARTSLSLTGAPQNSPGAFYSFIADTGGYYPGDLIIRDRKNAVNMAYYANTHGWNFLTPVTFGIDGSVAGTLNVSNGSIGAHTTIKSQAASNTLFNLPATNGTSGNCLATDGSGNTSWTTCGGGGAVPGVAGDVLFSSGAGTMQVDSGNFYYNLSAQTLVAPKLNLSSTTDGYASYVAGAGTLPALPANSMGFSAPPTGGTSGLIKLPSALSAGALTLAAPATISGVNQSQASVTPISSTGAPNALVETNASGVINPSLVIGPGVLRLEDNFCSGTTSTGNIGQLGWSLGNIGVAPVIGGAPGTWPYLCQAKFQTAAGATQSQGGSLSISAVGGNQPWGDFSTNTNWSLTYVFQLGSTTSEVFYAGLSSTVLGIPRTNSNIAIRYDTNSPGSAAAITSVVCTTTVCTVTLTSVNPLLVGQTWTITGETCPTRNVNVAAVATITSGATYKFNQTGAAETCTVQGTATSTAETTFKFMTTLTNSTTSTVVDSGITADTNWHKITIASTVSGTVTFTLDANAPVAISTNVPTTALLPTIDIATDVTAQKFVLIDYFNLLMTGLTR